eukprot:7596387-Ditylum_brightwellii.AAC.1
MGVHAMHPGSAPGDWVKPGDMPGMGYRSGRKGVMKNRDVVKKKELKKSRYQENTTFMNAQLTRPIIAGFTNAVHIAYGKRRNK